MSTGSPGFISLQKAIDMTTLYRENMNAVIDPVYGSRGVLCICDTFNKAAVETLVNKPECAAIRLYYGMDENLQLRPILVAVDSNNEDILPTSSTLGNDAVSSDIVDDSVRCPPYCPPPSALNH